MASKSRSLRLGNARLAHPGGGSTINPMATFAIGPAGGGALRKGVDGDFSVKYRHNLYTPVGTPLGNTGGTAYPQSITQPLPQSVQSATGQYNPVSAGQYDPGTGGWASAPPITGLGGGGGYTSGYAEAYNNTSPDNTGPGFGAMQGGPIYNSGMQSQLAELEQAARVRYNYNKAAMERARAEGKEEAAGLFADGSLGRIRENVSQEVVDQMAERAQQLTDLKGDTSQVDARDKEIKRVTDEFMDLLSQAKGLDPSGRIQATREQGQREIDKQLRQNLKGMAAISGQGGIRANAALAQDAYKTSAYSTMDLERQLMMDRYDLDSKALEQQRGVAESGAQQIGSSLKAREDIINQQLAQINEQRSRLEEINMLKEQDVKARQQWNLAQSAQEKYARLALEEGRVGQEIAALSASRSETLAEMSYLSQRDYMQQTLAIQRQQMNQPAPEVKSGGGSKMSLLCVQYWMMGDISDKVLEYDFRYTLNVPHIDEDVILAYYTWSSAISPWTFKQGLIYQALKPVVTAWANNMAAKSSDGIYGYRSTLGGLLETIGVPLHRWAGKLLKFIGYSMKDVRKDINFKTLTRAAKPIYDAVNSPRPALARRKIKWLKETSHAA